MKTRTHHMPALTRTFATINRCQQHPGELLTRDGECPRCEREAHQARMAVSTNAKEAAKMQQLHRANRAPGDKRRRMTGAEAERIAGGVL